MRTHSLVACVVLTVVTVTLGAARSGPLQLPPAPGDRITLRAARLFDGRGSVMTNAVIEIRGSRIAAIEQNRTGPVTRDLGDVTLMPGMIDVHVHVDWHFQPNGLYGLREGQPRETPEQTTAAIQANLDATLDAGVTTVQSLGAGSDKARRDAINAGSMRGPRILSSLGQIQAGTRTPDQLRELVRARKADGADVIKFFASGSIRDGGKMNVAQAQLDAVCGESKAVGLRSVVHAHDSDSIKAAAQAGCSQIEHGLFADDSAMRAMKDANMYFDPNIGLVLQNYLENKAKYMGSGSYNEEGFAFMEKAVPTLAPMFKRARAAGLRMPMGTDAVAGAHGQNAREAIARVLEGGQAPRDALVSATSLAAESLGLGKLVGSLALGYEADIIAVAGDPTKDITTLREVPFVMKGGKIEKGGK
jgi:imidazolonepropionase-like amidohydrolase